MGFVFKGGMIKSITHDIEVGVRTRYQEDASSPEFANYVYSYQITISNKGNSTVQLMSREWKITDGLGNTKTVNGPGVVGEQPVLSPGESHTYISGCNFQTTQGAMRGYYNFIRVADSTPFKVRIPQFNLIFPPSLN